MKQFFCDCCGKQTIESGITNMNVNNHKVDLCYKCQARLISKIKDATSKAEVEFMKTMKHQPLGFKYHCE